MKQQNNNRPVATKSSQYKITNWSEYNQALKQRGSLDIWVDNEVEKSWYYTGKKQKGAQYTYSDNCIEMICIIKEIYKLPYRQAEGFMRSLIKRMQWKVKVPDYTVINRRRRKLNIKVEGTITGKKFILIDSTGLKVYGEGEWKVRQHGFSKYRTWRKIHLTVDESNGLIESCEMTTNAVDDSQMIETLLVQVKGKIEKLAGDGGYDKIRVYKELEKRKIEPIIPPRITAKISKHGNCSGPEKPRDKNIRQIRKAGKKKWKLKTGYHRRSLIETTMFRFKNEFGEKLKSREFKQQQIEVKIKCFALNKIITLGKPRRIKYKKVA
jgi:IS5 family transposase